MHQHNITRTAAQSECLVTGGGGGNLNQLNTTVQNSSLLAQRTFITPVHVLIRRPLKFHKKFDFSFSYVHFPLVTLPFIHHYTYLYKHIDIYTRGYRTTAKRATIRQPLLSNGFPKETYFLLCPLSNSRGNEFSKASVPKL
jgi:hypothetical protein